MHTHEVVSEKKGIFKGPFTLHDCTWYSNNYEHSTKALNFDDRTEIAPVVAFLLPFLLVKQKSLALSQLLS